MTDWISPTEDWPLSQGFRPPSNPGHEGVDIAVWVGTLIVAPHDGTIITAGLTDPYGYGNLIIVDHGWDMTTRYGHMSQLWVGGGQWVIQGQPLGLSGGAVGAYGAGNSGGPHLHYEVRAGGVPIDPVPFLHPWGPPAPPPPPPGPDPRLIAAAQEDDMGFFPPTKTDDGVRWTVGVGTDQGIYVYRWKRDGTLLERVSLAGATNDRPSIIADGQTVTVFVRGTDQAEYARTWDGTKWQPWQLGGGAFVNPVTTS